MQAPNTGGIRQLMKQFSKWGQLGGWLCLGLLLWAGFPKLGLAQTPPIPAPPRSEVFPVPPADGYTLGPSDIISITIFNVPEQNGDFPVLPDGTINLPLIGPVYVEGLTLQQASEELSRRYASILRKPLITVGLRQSRPIRVAIAGEVSRPGAYRLDGGVLTVTDAIELAGGITQAADIRQVQLRRSRPRGVGVDQQITINLWELLQQGDLRQDLRLQDGDSLVIPAQTVLNHREAPLLRNASFAQDQGNRLDVVVVGAVRRPGPHSVDQATVTRAIGTAGGITQVADLRRVQVQRKTNSGTQQIINVNLWELLQTGNPNQDIPLQPRDTIIVPVAEEVDPGEVTELALASFAPQNISVNVVGAVRSPRTIQVSPNTPLNHAILATGNFTRSAKRNSVELVRLNLNGTVSRRKIKVDFDNDVDPENNPPLQDNDTVIVKSSAFSKFTTALGDVLTPLTRSLTLIRILDLD